MNMKQVGDAVKAGRLAKGESQLVMAARIGASQQIVSSWENGRRPVPKKYRRALARSYGVKFDTGEVVHAVDAPPTPCRRITDRQPDRQPLSFIEQRLVDQLRGVKDTLSELLVCGIRSRRGRVVLRARAR